MVRWCACVSCGIGKSGIGKSGIGKSGMAVDGRQDRWPRVGGLGGRLE